MADAEEVPSLVMHGCGFLFAYHVGVLEYVLDTFHMSVPADSKGSKSKSVPRRPVTISATSAASFPAVIWAANGERPLSWMRRDWPGVHQYFRYRPLALGAIFRAKEFFRDLWLRNLKAGAYESLNRAADRRDSVQRRDAAIGESVCGETVSSNPSLRKLGVQKEDMHHCKSRLSSVSSQSTVFDGRECESTLSENTDSPVSSRLVTPSDTEEDEFEANPEQEMHVPNPHACRLALTLTTNDLRRHDKCRFSSNEDLVDALMGTTHIPGIFGGLTRVEGLGPCWDGALGRSKEDPELSKCKPVVVSPYVPCRSKQPAISSSSCCLRRKQKSDENAVAKEEYRSGDIDISGHGFCKVAEHAFPPDLNRCLELARRGYADAMAKHDIFVERGWIELGSSCQRTKSDLAA